ALPEGWQNPARTFHSTLNKLALFGAASVLEGFLVRFPLRHLGFHLPRHLFNTDWGEIPAVNAHVKRQHALEFRKHPVAVPVQLPRALVAAVPYAHGIVAERDRGDALNLRVNALKLPHPDPRPRHAFCDAVMVTRDEVDVPRQTTAEIDRFTLCDFQGEIAEVVYQVPRLDQRIVAVDDRLVHFVDVSKRAAPPQREDI